jgi:hypothetical protein
MLSTFSPFRNDENPVVFTNERSLQVCDIDWSTQNFGQRIPIKNLVELRINLFVSQNTYHSCH